MTDLHERFRAEFDAIPAPELWDRIESLAVVESTASEPVRVRRGIAIAIAAFAAVVVVIAAATLALRGGGIEVFDDRVVPDTVEWSRVPHDDAVFGGEGGAEMLSIATNGSGFVAVGVTGDGVGDWRGDRNAAAWTSLDGVAWSRVPHDPDVFGDAGEQEMLDATVGGPGYVAVGYRFDEPGKSGVYPGVWVSPDGVTWSTASDDPESFGGMDGAMSSVTVGGPGLVAVGQTRGGAAVWTSEDGITWTSVVDTEMVFDGGDMVAVTESGSVLVAVGRGGAYPSSSSNDGITFTHEPGSSSAAVWTSPDGINWARVSHDEAVFGGAAGQHCGMDAVTAGGSGLVAVGSCEGYSVESAAEDGMVTHGDRVVIWTSADGHTWSQVPRDEMVFVSDPSIDPDQSAYLDLYAINDGLIAFDLDGTWFSSDGYTWTRTSDHTMDGGVADVVTTRAGLVAVGGDEGSAAVWVAERTQ